MRRAVADVAAILAIAITRITGTHPSAGIEVRSGSAISKAGFARLSRVRDVRSQPACVYCMLVCYPKYLAKLL